MTRIFTEGAEMQDILFWQYGTATIGSSTPAYSPYYYTADSCGRTLPSNLTEIYARARIRFPYVADYFKFFGFGKDSYTSIAWVGISSLNKWKVVTTSGVLEESGVIANANQWCLLEVYYKIDDAPNGRFELKVDGTIVCNFTGDTKPGADTSINTIYFWANAGQGFNFLIDDIAINDTDNSDGKNDNSWCGDGIIVKITPSGSGTTNAWLNSGSVSGSANYLYVDEYPHDSDTTYVYASGSSVGVQDQYAASNFDGAGKTITHFHVEGRARKTKADSTNVKIGYFPDGGTDQLSGSIALTGIHSRIVGTETVINPVTSASWTAADINALELVVEI